MDDFLYYGEPERRVREALQWDKCPDRNLRIIQMRMRDDYTLREISDTFGISPERIRQIIYGLRVKLRKLDAKLRMIEMRKKGAEILNSASPLVDWEHFKVGDAIYYMGWRDGIPWAFHTKVNKFTQSTVQFEDKSRVYKGSKFFFQGGKRVKMIDEEEYHEFFSQPETRQVQASDRYAELVRALPVSINRNERADDALFILSEVHQAVLHCKALFKTEK